jgi:hypothetical protein
LHWLYLIAALQIAPLKAIASEEASTQQLPDYALMISVDGKRAIGSMDLAAKYPDSDLQLKDKKGTFERDFDASVIPVTRGQRLNIKIELDKNGTHVDVTRDRNLYVEFSLGQMRRVSPDEILVEPSEDAPLRKDAGLIEMVVAYRAAADSKVGYNQILFRIVP